MRGYSFALALLQIIGISKFLCHHIEIVIPEIIPDYDYGQDGGTVVGNGCACLLYAERQLVFRSENTTTWYSCTPWGLHRCGEYCDYLLADEGMRNRSRQNACDTLGKEMSGPWYVRHQVCGEYGPHQDFQMHEDLCCRRGRPRDGCGSL